MQHVPVATLSGVAQEGTHVCRRSDSENQGGCRVQTSGMRLHHVGSLSRVVAACRIGRQRVSPGVHATFDMEDDATLEDSTAGV